MKILDYVYNEAKSHAGEISAANSNRLHSIITQRIKRKFGVKAYIQAGRVPIISASGKVYGIMIMLGDGQHAFRLNYSQESGGNVTGVDFWIYPSPDPQLHINTNELNIVQLVSAIEEVLDKKTSGTILIDEDGDEEDSSNTQEDYQEARYSKEERAVRRADREERKKEKESRKKKINVQKLSGDDRLDVDGASEYNALFDEPLGDEELFALVESQIDAVKNKKIRSLLILGDPGVGKTYTVTQKLLGSNYQSYTGGITSASALYKTLFMNNNPDKILVFDDLDSLFDDNKSSLMLKGALDSSEKTEISYISKNCVDPLFYSVLIEKTKLTPDVIEELEKMKINTSIFDTDHGQSKKLLNKMKARALSPDSPNAILPTKFNFVGRVIFISNKYIDQIPESIVSRSTFIEVNLTLEQIIRRIEKVLPNLKLNGSDVDMLSKKKALAFLKDIVVPSKKIRKIDFRGFGDILKFAISGAPEEVWHRWAAVSIKQKYGAQEVEKNRRKR